MKTETRGVPDYPRIKNIVYSTQFGSLPLDLYLATASGPRPALLYIHGGAWSNGNKNGGYGLALVPALATAGITVASLNYRLAPGWQFPAMMEDVRCAIRFMRANAQQWNIDANHIGVIGNSAGGHLASLAALIPGSQWITSEWPDVSSNVQLAICLWGPSDLRSATGPELKDKLIAVFGEGQECLRVGSPIVYVNNESPPFLIVNGLSDTTVPPAQAVALHDALTGYGCESTLVLVANAGHSLAQVGPGPLDPSQDAVDAQIVQFVVGRLERGRLEHEGAKGREGREARRARRARRGRNGDAVVEGGVGVGGAGDAAFYVRSQQSA